MMASPLFFTGDMARLDDFTLNLLCNAEVIEVNQDPLGRQGRPVIIRGSQQIWTKQMEDGSLVVGLFNRDEIEQTVTLQWKDIDIKGRRRVRDLWRQKNLGTFKDKFQTNIPRHGVSLIRLYAPN